jgi:hypothetical protein
MSAGMQCLRNNLGELESEIFIATIKAEDFNYTDWRQNQPWINTPIDEIVELGTSYIKNNPDVIPSRAKLI